MPYPPPQHTTKVSQSTNYKLSSVCVCVCVCVCFSDCVSCACSDSKGGVLRSSLRSITDSGSLRSITDAGRLRSISEAGLAGVKRRHSGSGGGADTGADTGDTGSCGDDGNSKARPTLTHHSPVKSAARSVKSSRLKPHTLVV